VPEYSISKLDTFEEWPRQYGFIYVDRIMRYEESVEGFLGQRFHDAMELREFAPHESALCDWCAYQDLCPAKKHLVKVEGLPKDKWKDEPGVVIVDAYAEKWRKKKEMETEIEAIEVELEDIKEAAIGFAEREGVSVIAGTEARLRVTGKDRLISPGKGSEKREALERELRAAGVWDEVSTLDSAALEKAIAEGRWDAGILDRVRAYISSEKRYTVTLKDDA
jgi:hypothetical protein